MSSEFIKSLVIRAKEGDVQSFGKLYDIYREDMYRFAWYYTGSSTYAEEAVSNAVLSAFENITSLKKAESFKSWLFTILYNECKRAQREKMTANGLVEYGAQTETPAPEGDSDEIIALKNALTKLGDEEKEIIILYYSCGYTSKEISSLTGIRHSTVRSKISRATDKLRQLLAI